MKSILIPSFLFLFFSFSPLGFNQSFDLTVGDPRQSFYTKQGTIENASITVHNKGLFAEVGLYLSFSARGSNYKSNDSLEVVLNFQLPEKAIVIDSWLWIYDDICRADSFELVE